MTFSVCSSQKWLFLHHEVFIFKGNLYTCGLFNDSVKRSYYMAPNESMISE
jgi:hypothetical protein